MYVVGTVGVEKRALPQGLDLFVYTMVISIAKAKIQTKQRHIDICYYWLIDCTPTTKCYIRT